MGKMGKICFLELTVRKITGYTAWKESKYGVFSGPYFPVFGLNTGKYGPEKTPYLDTFHAVLLSETSLTVNSHCATFFMDLTHWFSSKMKNSKI